jgi:hypothetical protein
MAHIQIRFNKSRGQPGRGTPDHAWRVFVDKKEYLCKEVTIMVVCHSERDGDDWNIACEGTIDIDREKSLITVIPYALT